MTWVRGVIRLPRKPPEPGNVLRYLVGGELRGFVTPVLGVFRAGRFLDQTHRPGTLETKYFHDLDLAKAFVEQQPMTH